MTDNSERLAKALETILEEMRAARQAEAEQRSLDRNRNTAQWQTDYRSNVLRVALGVFFAAIGFYYGVGWISTNPNVKKTLYPILLLVAGGGFVLIIQDVMTAVERRRLVAKSWLAESLTGTKTNSFDHMKQTFWGDLRFVIWYMAMIAIAVIILYHDHGVIFWR